MSDCRPPSIALQENGGLGRLDLCRCRQIGTGCTGRVGMYLTGMCGVWSRITFTLTSSFQRALRVQDLRHGLHDTPCVVNIHVELGVSSGQMKPGFGCKMK